MLKVFGVTADPPHTHSSQAPPEPTTLFAVFDGHCGDKAAKFAASNLPRYLKQAADLSPESLEKVYHQSAVLLYRWRSVY